MGGLPSKNVSSDFEEGEAQKAVFTPKSLAFAITAFIALGLVFFYVVGQNVIYSIIYASGISLAGLILSDSSLTKIERDRVLGTKFQGEGPISLHTQIKIRVLIRQNHLNKSQPISLQLPFSHTKNH